MLTCTQKSQQKKEQEQRKQEETREWMVVFFLYVLSGPGDSFSVYIGWPES